MKVSIVIPTYNRAHQLLKLLKSLDCLRKTLPEEVVVVDDCSTDNTRSVVKSWAEEHHSFDVRYVKSNKNGGPAKARNLGIENAVGEGIAFTDSDCVVHELWVDALKKHLEKSPSLAGIGGKVQALKNDPISRYYSYYHILEPPASLCYLVTANCIYNRELIRNVGGFVETIGTPGGEDIGLSFKLYLKGHRFGYDENAIVYHDYRNSLMDFIRTFYHYGYGNRTISEMCNRDVL